MKWLKKYWYEIALLIVIFAIVVFAGFFLGESFKGLESPQLREQAVSAGRDVRHFIEDVMKDEDE